jgi:hypothetical protein
MSETAAASKALTSRWSAAVFDWSEAAAAAGLS